MTKTIPWSEIKTMYLLGVKPKEIAEKFELTSKQVRDKANKEKWTRQKSTISDKIEGSVNEKISNLTGSALDVLKVILGDDKAKAADKINAAKAVIDISGLKVQKQELSGKDGNPIETSTNLNISAQDIKEHAKDLKEFLDGLY